MLTAVVTGPFRGENKRPKSWYRHVMLTSARTFTRRASVRQQQYVLLFFFLAYSNCYLCVPRDSFDTLALHGNTMETGHKCYMKKNIPLGLEALFLVNILSWNSIPAEKNIPVARD